MCRLRLISALAIFAFSLGAPAIADDRDDCRKADPGRSIASCTRIIQASGGYIDRGIIPAKLRLGDRGPEIEALQSFLASWGYEIGAIDGVYGPATHQATLQAAKRLRYSIRDLLIQSLKQAALAAAYDNRGLAYAKKAQYGPAMADFDRAIRLKPDLAQAWDHRCKQSSETARSSVACPIATGATLTLSGNQHWIVIASRQDVRDATAIAERYAGARVVRAENGWYAIVLGPELVSSIDDFRKHYDGSVPIPDDAYLAYGKNFVETIWPPETRPDGAAAFVTATASWRLVENGPTGPEIDAQLTLPNRETKVHLAIHKSADGQPPTGLVVEVTFETDALRASILEVPRFVPKPDESGPGLPLIGVADRVVDGSFSIALSTEPNDIPRNMALLWTRDWIDLPFVDDTGRRGVLSFEKGEEGQAVFQTAIAAWEKAETSQEESADCADNGNPETIVRACSKIISSATKGDESLALAYRTRGVAYGNQSDWDRAVADFNEAVRLAPNSSATFALSKYAFYYRVADRLARDGDLTGALSHFRVAARLVPEGDPWHQKALQRISEIENRLAAKPGVTSPGDLANCLGSSYFTHFEGIDVTFDPGIPGRIISSCTNIIQGGKASGGNLVIAYYNRGRAYLKKGDYDRAIADFTKAIAVQPHFGLAYCNRGVAFLRKGDRRLAIVNLRVGLHFLAANDPNRSAFEAHLADLEQEVAEPEPVSTGNAPSPVSPTPEKATLYEEPLAGSSNGVTAINASVTWQYNKDGPNGPEVEANLEVPERQMKVRLSLHKNSVVTLPASHLIAVTVDTPADFPGKSIDEIPRIVFKPQEDARGQPLVGAAAKVADGFFWIALSANKNDIASNMELLSGREWIDLPFVYGNGQRAILTFEKGEAGDEALAAALTAWVGPERPSPQWNDCRAVGDPDKIVRACSAIIAAGKEGREDLGVAYFNRGLAYSYEGDYDRAIADYSEAVRLRPDYGYAYYWRGNAHDALGDSAGALNDFHVASQLIPEGDPWRRKALQRIAEIETALAEKQTFTPAPSPELEPGPVPNVPSVRVRQAPTTSPDSPPEHLTPPKPYTGGGAVVTVSYLQIADQKVAWVEVDGGFEPGDETFFKRALLTVDSPIVVVSLKSPGGDLRAGMEIGRTIWTNQYATVVKDGVCASACAFAWLAGRPRFATADAQIGFHAPTRADDPNRQSDSVGSALVGGYLNGLGLTSAAIAYITEKRPQDMQWLSFADADRLGIYVEEWQ